MLNTDRPVPFPVLAALWVLLGMSLTTTARADLTFSGGTHAQQAQIEQVFAALPACCHTSCSVCVRLLDDQAMNACLQASAASHSQRLVNADAVDGFYQNSPSAITLRTPSRTADVTMTFTHEYGHFVWVNVLSPARRDQYRTIYEAQRAASRLVSTYAAVSLTEGFAEAFSFYVQRRPLLAQKDSASCRFLDGLVNGQTKQP